MVRAAAWPGFACGAPSTAVPVPGSGVAEATPYGAVVTLSDTPWQDKEIALPLTTVGVWVWTPTSAVRVQLDTPPAQEGLSPFDEAVVVRPLFTSGATVRPNEDFYLQVDQTTLARTLHLKSGDPYVQVTITILTL
jgi:hypothetical protein